MGVFAMPSLGADMESGTVTQWLVTPGDTVKRGDIVAVVETEKSDIEVEIFESGVITELLVPAGERVPVGTPLATVAGEGPAVPAVPLRPARVPAAARAHGTEPEVATTGLVAQPLAPSPAPVVAPGPAGPPASVPATSPMVRNLAARRGVELGTLHGTGPGGTVTRHDVETAAQPRRPTRRRSSPAARRRAWDLGLDLDGVPGTGPTGAIVLHDVLRAAGAAPGPSVVPPAVEAVPAQGSESADRQAALRRAIGALMARSKREIPHYYLATTVDARNALAWLEETNAERPVERRLVLPVLLLKATAVATRAVPEMNGFFTDSGFQPSSAVHVGVAVSLRGGGVIAPAIHDVDRLDLDAVMEHLRDLVGRARKGVLRSSEMSDPTITVTNLGDLGVEEVFGVIYPPQVALVGFGRVTEKPYADHGLVGVRSTVTATLSADHRASDGHRGGRFLAEIDRLLQEPGKL